MLLHWVKCDKCGKILKDNSAVTYERTLAFANRENFDLCRDCRAKFKSLIVEPKKGYCWHCGKKIESNRSNVYKERTLKDKPDTFVLCHSCRDKLIVPLMDGRKEE